MRKLTIAMLLLALCGTGCSRADKALRPPGDETSVTGDPGTTDAAGGEGSGPTGTGGTGPSERENQNPDKE
jgi:hypothetical protein